MLTFYTATIIMNQTNSVANFPSYNPAALKTTIVHITPDIATQLLEQNFPNNRKISEKIVKHYARLMKENQWGLSEPLKFTAEGVLIDGQHRLKAVIASGVACDFIVISGYSVSSAFLLDQGFSRKTLHILQLKDIHYSNNELSCLRMAISAANGFSRSIQYSPNEMSKLLIYFNDGVKFACKRYISNSTRVSSSIFAVVLMAYYKENHQRLSDFLYCVQTGESKNGTKDNAALKLGMLYEATKKDGQVASQRYSLFRKAQSALISFLKGETPKFFKETEKIVWSKTLFSRENLKVILSDSELTQ